MSEEAFATLAFGLLSLLLLFGGFRKGFFRFPQTPWEVPLRLFHVVIAFSIYFLVTTLGIQFAMKVLQRNILTNYNQSASWINFFLSLLIAVFLFLYLWLLPAGLRKGILQPRQTDLPWKEDLWTAFYAWLLSFPLVLFLNQALEIFIAHVFDLTRLPDQVAVRFLKSTFDNPLYFFLAVLSIVILAPLVEETLFRGFLQTYIRRHLGPKQAIFITSVCFSLFHYAAGQGLGNIAIIPSLFVLALFLGFLYEKQGSIAAPMFLHASFNAVSVVNLYLFGGFLT